MDRAGRRVLLLLAGTGMALTSFTMGVYYHMQDADPQGTNTLLFSIDIGYGQILSFCYHGHGPWHGGGLTVLYGVPKN